MLTGFSGQNKIHALWHGLSDTILLSSHGWSLSWPPLSYRNKFSPDSLLLCLGCVLLLLSLLPPSSPIPSYGGNGFRKGPVALLAKDRPCWLECTFTFGAERIWVLWYLELIQFGTPFQEKEYKTTKTKLEKSKYLKLKKQSCNKYLELLEIQFLSSEISLDSLPKMLT